MSDIYTSLNLSPRKKRVPVEPNDDTLLTPKKLRQTAVPPPTPRSLPRKAIKKTAPDLPPHLARLYNIQTALQNAISQALATCAVSPTPDTGVVRNVLNHISLTSYAGLRTRLDLEDIKRLCWLWEWDGETFSKSSSADDGNDNPFLDDQAAPKPKDWTRGSMGLVITPTTHYSKSFGKRVPAYGIGVEVEMDLDKDMSAGVAAVARWTAAGETRRKEIRQKLDKWIQLHSDIHPVPNIPEADLPPLATSTQLSSLTRLFAAASPTAAPSSSLPEPPSPTLSSPKKSPIKGSSVVRDFAIPFPISSGQKNTVVFPQTPSRHDRLESKNSLSVPQTPMTSPAKFSVPSTPMATTPRTPSSSRREALYERVRQRSLSASPSKIRVAGGDPANGEQLTRDQLLRMSQEEKRRRCLLGRLGSVAESVWMLFSTPVASTATPTSRKRRALPTSEVALAVMKSSPVPISTADASESLDMLAKLCPFFLKKLEIASEEWLEMPMSSVSAADVEGSPSGKAAPPSPGPSRGKHESADEILTRSPRRVKKEAGGLREVREIVRRELELTE